MSVWTDFKNDIEELERQKRERALRAVNRAEVTGWDLLWFFTKVLIWASVIALLVIGWLSL
jgi:hypothetical protein